ncbi:hypothetical protein [Aurantibacillus circumpalustris]|uniref:hypothetical protein n=1 Tax=Aurantibacillus circumpalustris TaxID=3036359 RepID=UPI00295B84F8|nr:hypothetical protein [Aurantibacillus circumpalustris]
MLYLILIVAFSLRILPRILLPKAIGDDGYSYFSDAQLIRDHKQRMPEFYNKTLFKSKFGYAHYYSKLLSLFPKKFEIIVEMIVSPLADTLIVLVSFLFFKDVMEYSHLQIEEYYYLLFAAVLTLLPAYLKNDTGPRAYQGSARVIGQLFFLLIVLMFHKYISSNNFIFLMLASFVGSLMFPMSAFGSQAFIFTGIFIGLVLPSYYLVVVLSAVFLFLISFGKAIQRFEGRFGHYNWYFKFYQKATLYKWKYLSNPISDYFTQIKFWLKLLVTFKWRSLLIYFNICYNPIHLLVTSFFFFVSAFFFFNSDNGVLNFLSTVVLSVLLVYLLTMLKPLLFLGEAYRYLEYGVVPGLILFFIQFNNYKWFLPFILIWMLIAIVRYIYYVIEFLRNNKSSNDNYPFYQEFFLRINPLIEGNVYGSVYFRTKAAYFGTFNYFGNRGFMNLNYLSLDDNYLAFGNYPAPSGDFIALIRRFDLKYWLTTKNDLDDYLIHTKEYGDLLSVLELVDTDERLDIFLYKIKES